MADTRPLAPTYAELLGLNVGEVYFSESPSKYPEAGHGTQYHAGAPGVLAFAREVLAKWGAQPVVREPLTRQQLREAFHKDTGCTLGGDIDLAERVCGVVERAHGITTNGRKDAP